MRSGTGWIRLTTKSLLAIFCCLVWIHAAVADEDRNTTYRLAGEIPDEQYQRKLMARYEQMVNYNLDNDHTLPSSLIDSVMREYKALSIGDRIAAWADYFWTRGDVTYLFGLKSDGYVTQGRLIDDYATDCILFFYRVTELGRSSSALEAVQFAFGTRFLGASLEKIVDEDGKVDYNDPVHLDFTIDIINSGIWGRQVTKEIGRPTIDEAGSTRYDGGGLSFVASDQINYDRLQSGDVIYLVTDEKSTTGKKLREYGSIIGHVGIVRIEGADTYLIHPASKPIEGVYQGGKVEKVLLKTYLDRVETFKGIMATRIENF